MAQENRRRSDRQPLERLGKVLHVPSCRFSAMRSINVSSSGLLARVYSLRPMRVGEPVSVALAEAHGPVFEPEMLVPARVVRAGAHDGVRQEIAVAFVPD